MGSYLAIACWADTRCHDSRGLLACPCFTQFCQNVFASIPEVSFRFRLKIRTSWELWLARVASPTKILVVLSVKVII